MSLEGTVGWIWRGKQKPHWLPAHTARVALLGRSQAPRLAKHLCRDGSTATGRGRGLFPWRTRVFWVLHPSLFQGQVALLVPPQSVIWVWLFTHMPIGSQKCAKIPWFDFLIYKVWEMKHGFVVVPWITDTEVPGVIQWLHHFLAFLSSAFQTTGAFQKIILSR